MQNQLFEAALGIAKPWYVGGVDFDPAAKTLNRLQQFGWNGLPTSVLKPAEMRGWFSGRFEML